MNAVNHALTRLFDALLGPLDALGRPLGLILTSAVFGVLALIVFKRISWQRRIKAAKNRIKAHLIEIRLYQDDLGIVGRAIGRVLFHNGRYMALNLAPFVPLSIPFAMVLAQLVARYGYAPVPLHVSVQQHAPAQQHAPVQQHATWASFAGSSTTIQVELARARWSDVSGLRIELPPGVEARSPLVRAPNDGRAFQEIFVTAPGVHEIGFALADGTRESKRLVAGSEASSSLQPARGKGFFSALFGPAEDTLAASSPFDDIRIDYPDSRLGWLPGGPSGVVIVFLVASMVAGALVLKPLKIQI